MNTTSKQVMDIKTSKGIAESSNEQLRRWTDKGWDQAQKEGNYDRTREHLNFEVGRGGVITPVDKSRTLPERMAENLGARGIIDRNEGLKEPKYRTVVNFIFGGSRERMRELAFGSQEVDFTSGADNSAIHRKPEIEQWAKDIYDFVSEKYGEENIVSFIVHLDETNPHVHCAIMPIDENQKFAFKKMFCGKSKVDFKRNILELHNELAKVNEKWGLNRGSSIAATGNRHRSTEEYRRWLTQECVTLEEERENHQKALSDLNVEIAIAQKKQKSFTTMVENLTKEKDSIEKELKELRSQLKDGENTSEELASKIKDLEWQLSGTEEKLADKIAKLSDTEEKLATLMKDYQEIEVKAEELTTKANDSEKSWSENMAADLHTVMLERVVNEFVPRLKHMQPSDKELFDGTLLNELATDGNKVVTVALHLMCGFVDEATTFAETHGGGGGGGSDLKWGRDPEEDDREWASRCLAMARKMMMPTSGKKKKM